jgi:putative redox protein
MAKVTVRSEAGLRQSIQAGKHQLTADEPEGTGGQDEGPDPYSLLLSALGACTAITLRMYAERKSWPLERVTVDLIHQKVHADDCADCEGKAGFIDRIERHIQLEGPLAPEQVAKLGEIAEKCPVHKTLKAGPVIKDKVSLKASEKA